ncbi:hypothetical protein, partial [Nocardia wallacei]|uniref:hypothetical protein n=1 Tax=Nocardia wallacei TaxID=480035 RepID=UPI00245859B8
GRRRTRIAHRPAVGAGRGPLPISGRSRTDAVRMVERFRTAYELPRFSLHRAADTLTRQLARLDRSTLSAGDLCHEAEVLLRCAAPILIDLAAALPDTAIDGIGARATVEPIALPRLSPVEG